MSRIVGSPSSSVEISFGEVEGERIDAPKSKTAEPSSSSIELWTGGERPSLAGATSEGPMISGQDLAAQSARETADLKKAKAALAGFEAPLAKLAAKYPDPISYFGNLKLGGKEVAFGAFGDVVHGDAFNDAAAKLSPSDVRAALEEQVKKAWPQCSPKEVEQLKHFFMHEVNESLREGVAPRLQETATRMLDGAAQSFQKTAADPAAVSALATRLTGMADELADVENQASVRDLRIALGVDPNKKNVLVEELTRGLKERASVLHREAHKMKFHDRPTLFRALAEQDVGSLYKETKGVREGSILAAQIDAVRTTGESEAATIKHVKLASMVATAFITGGMGLAGIGAGAVGAGASLSLGAPSVLQAWEAVDTAKAGESAGTMKIGSEEDARREAVIETGVAVVSAGTATAAGEALHGVMHHAAPLVGGAVHAGIEFASEESFDTVGHQLAESLSSEGRATGRNALERAKQ